MPTSVIATTTNWSIDQNHSEPAPKSASPSVFTMPSRLLHYPPGGEHHRRRMGARRRRGHGWGRARGAAMALTPGENRPISAVEAELAPPDGLRGPERQAADVFAWYAISDVRPQRPRP